ncbi:MAG TPA: DNA repair and recombination protein RadA, partial [Acidilobales archaeon]|nr:DNA repair and recombination protein RadA [Acidilobales archaeon]
MSSRKVRSIEDLGLSASIINKLKEAGYRTLEAIAVANINELASVVGLPVPTAQRIISKARDALGLRFMTALELKKERLNIGRITTGSRKLDELLGGGVETRTITEFFGEYGTGKTQICMQLAVNVQLPKEKGGLEGKALFIDSEGTFRWERVEAMARAVGLDPDKAMSNIIWARAISSDHQMAIVEEAMDLIPKEN